MSASVRARLRARASTLAPTTKARIRRVLASRPAAATVRLLRPVRSGNVSRLLRLGAPSAIPRGTPLPHLLTERFLHRHATDVRGRVLVLDRTPLPDHVGSPATVERVSADADSDTVTLLADLGEPGSVPVGEYDCVVAGPEWLAGTDRPVAISNLWAGVAPHGTLLMAASTVPVRADRTGAGWIAARAFTALVAESCTRGDVEIETFGNPATAAATVLGLAAEDLAAEDLERDDPAAASLLGARVRRVGR